MTSEWANITQLKFEKQERGKKTPELFSTSSKQLICLKILSRAMNQKPQLCSHYQLPCYFTTWNHLCGEKKKRDRAQKATLHKKKKGGGASHAENKQQKRNFQKRIWMLNVPSNSVIYTKWMLRASCYSCALPRIRNNMTNGERMYLHPLSLWLVLQCF